jgi:meso-butanediol dehydrogenase / (S,S)-butanediol dehydrogenase / diacetyl reductase
VSNQRSLEGKTAIVTGAGRGIGRAIATRLAADGAEVMVVARTGSELAEVVQELKDAGRRAWALEADLYDQADIAAVVAAATSRWPRIDVLVNNAGTVRRAAFLDTTADNWEEVLGLNLTSVFRLSQAVARHMAQDSQGVILHNASIDTLGADGPCVSYNASKTGLLGLTRTMAVELASVGIRVNAVSPGFTWTPMTASHRSPELVEYMQTSFDRVPMRRMVQPEEVASVFAFLASDDASAITGQNIVVDCGLTANLYVLETLPEPVTMTG